jgi:phytoene dehydrogenase-like protein
MDAHYDAIVIGSGLAGLTAGALFAKQGKRVLVLERHDKFGGAATVYHRKKIGIEVGLHEMDGMDEEDPKFQTWTELGLWDRVETIRLPEFYGVKTRSDGPVFCLPEGLAAAEAALCTQFPEQQKALRHYFQESVRVRRGFSALSGTRMSLAWWLLSFPRFLYGLIRANTTDVATYFDDLFGDNEALKKILAANLSYYSDNPERMPKSMFLMTQGSFYVGGSHYIKGGSQALSDALIDIIVEAGGEARTLRCVTQIVTEGKRAIGVEHVKAQSIVKQQLARHRSFEEGHLADFNHQLAHKADDVRKAFAPVIFGNAAPPVLKALLPAPLADEFYQPHRDKPVSQSCFTLYLGLNKNPQTFGLTYYSTFIFSAGQKTFRDSKHDCRMFAREPAAYCGQLPGYVITDYNRIDSGLNEAERYFICVAGLDHIDNWQHLSEQAYYQRKALWQQALIDDVDQHYPGIKDAIIYQDFGTARTVRDYLNTPGGAIIGYELTTPYPFKGKLRDSTPSCSTAVKGLYLASAFAMAGGFSGAMTSGSFAAKQAATISTKQR